jgi:predicted kinase
MALHKIAFLAKTGHEKDFGRTKRIPPRPIPERGTHAVKVSKAIRSYLLEKGLMPSFAGPHPVYHNETPIPSAHQAAHIASQMTPSGGSEHPKPSFETNKMYGDGQGNYHPSRVALHDKLVGHAMNGGLGKPGSEGGEHADLAKMYGDHAKGNGQKHAVFLMGGGGSGKGYYKDKKFGHHPRFVNIDPDEMKEHLAHADGDTNGHNVHPENYHEESSDLAKRLHSDTMKAGKSFIYDGTGAGKSSLEKKLKQTKAAGYQVHLHYVQAPLHVALDRNNKRDRTVPEHILVPQHGQVMDSFRHNRQFADKIKVVHSLNKPAPSSVTQRREELASNISKALDDPPFERGAKHFRRSVAK